MMRSIKASWRSFDTSVPIIRVADVSKCICFHSRRDDDGVAAGSPRFSPGYSEYSSRVII